MEVTAERITANQQNAQKSTGPVTPAGKARAALNATKRGLLARNVVLSNEVARESLAELDHFLNDLRSDLQPSGALEDALVERIATCHWRLARAHRFESYALDNCPVRERQTAEIDELRADLTSAEGTLKLLNEIAAIFEKPQEDLTSDDRRELEEFKEYAASQTKQVDADDEQDDDDEQDEEYEDDEDEDDDDDEEVAADDDADGPDVTGETAAGDDSPDETDDDSDDAADDTAYTRAREYLDWQFKSVQSRISLLSGQLDKAEYKLAQRTLRTDLTSLLPQSADLLDLVRYESMLDRQLHRALSELHRLRALHGDRPGPRRHLRAQDEDSGS